MHNGSGAEYYWVETYDEALEAVELLKSHGSTFEESLIFSYDGDLFDTKYCFYMNYFTSDRIDWGENPFDRKSENVRVTSVAFFEEISIDDLVKGRVSWYDAYELKYNYDLKDYSDIDYKSLSGEWDVKERKVNITVDEHSLEVKYDVYYIKNYILTVDDGKTISIEQERSDFQEVISDECIDAIVNSITVFNGK